MTVPAPLLTAYAALQIGDAIACAIPVAPITEALDRVGCPDSVRRVLPPIKIASAVGLLVGRRDPAIARVTGIALTTYFGLAIAAHVRVKDTPANMAPAVGLAALSAFVAVRSR